MPVYLWLEFAPGIPPSHLHAVAACFEFAAYRPWISEALLGAARGHVEELPGVAKSRLADLTRREAAPEEVDAAGYRESRLFTSFTHLGLCVDQEDENNAGEVLAAFGLTDAAVVEFEYHGRLHYSWPACAVVARSLETGENRESPQDAIRRITACIEIAHTFLGTCEAFDRLFSSEVRAQVASYVRRHARSSTASSWPNRRAG